MRGSPNSSVRQAAKEFSGSSAFSDFSGFSGFNIYRAWCRAGSYACLLGLLTLQTSAPQAIAQDSASSSSSRTSTSNNANNVQIIPPAPDAIGGGNPFQGLGRSDESAPSRRSQFESADSSYSPSSNSSSSAYSSSTSSASSPLSTSSPSSYAPASPSSGSSNPIPGSVNPNVPPDLPPTPSAPDSIEAQREREEKEREIEAQKKAEEREKQKAERSPSAAVDTPLKRALLELQLRNYDKSLSQLDDIIAANPGNAEAHYLRAVIYVLTRKYDAAATEYRAVLKNDPSPTLSRKARTGLAKLTR